MTIPHFSVLTICGIDELPEQGLRKVTHVLSLLDPDLPEIESFQAYGDHHRTTLRFNDIIDPKAGFVMPQPGHMEEILTFGAGLEEGVLSVQEPHLLVHCHMGVSRSTAAMLSLMAQASPDTAEDLLFDQLRRIRPQAWPNSVMIAYADDMLGRGGRLTEALRGHYARQMELQPELSSWMVQLGRAREVDMAG